MKLRVAAALWAALTVPAASVACGSSDAHQADAETRVITVRAVEVTEEDIVQPIVAAGTLGAKEEIALGFKIGGVIADIRVNAGDVVRAGETLAVLDPREIDAAVARAQSASDKAERDHARAQRLYTDSVVTRVQLEDAETAAQIARADLESARFNRRYATIVAPSDGVVLRRFMEPGEVISTGTAVLSLGSRARGTVVRVGLADRDIVRVRRGDAATVHFDALPERVFQGVVTELAAAAEASTGTYLVEVSIPAAAGFASGLVGTVEIRPAGSTRASIVPLDAVLEADGDRATLFALSADGERAERREVTVAFITGDRVVVTSGLDGVRAVLTDGAAYLNDGVAVRVMP
jgi:multidrug efflux system membrane fusion protein